MLKFRNYLGHAMASCAIALTACGGGGDSASGNATVRIVNATLTHNAISLLSNATVAVASTPIDTVSDYVAVASGSPTLQINDAASGSALGTLAPSVGANAHYVLVSYENGGVLRTTVINEDVVAPAAGTASLRVFNAATDAGALDVYVTDAAAALTSPNFIFASSTVLQTSSFLSITPGTYRVRVTGGGNPADIRLDIPSIVLTSQGVSSLILTPTTGGTLVNGALLAQQGAYAPGRNKSARVRLAVAVTGGASVTVNASGTPIGSAVVSPAVGAYTLVTTPSTLNISVNGNSVAAPAAALAAGSDSTLLIYGPAGAATASLVVDDNHLPTTTTNLKIRLLNGLTGAASPLTLNAGFAVVASNVVPGAASPYAVIGSSTALRLDVFSPSSLTPVYSETLPIPGNAVFTLFMLGDAGAPVHLLQRDR